MHWTVSQYLMLRRISANRAKVLVVSQFENLMIEMLISGHYGDGYSAGKYWLQTAPMSDLSHTLAVLNHLSITSTPPFVVG
jgi:hypothetical protein